MQFSGNGGAVMRVSNIEEVKSIVKRMQKVVFGIMCDIDDFCKENNIEASGMIVGTYAA